MWDYLQFYKNLKNINIIDFEYCEYLPIETISKRKNIIKYVYIDT